MMKFNILPVVLLSCIVHHVHSWEEFSNDSCYAIKKIKIDIGLQTFPEDRYASTIYFLSDNINPNVSLNEVWKRCSVLDPPITSGKLKQIATVFNFLHLANDNISCAQFNQLYSLKMHNFPFDYYYYNFGQIGKSYPANNQSVCELEVEILDIRESPKSIDKVIRNESFCEFTKLRVLRLISSDIWEIEADAFVCLEQLVRIDLRGNHLSSLPERVFSHNQRLQTAILLRNRFNSTIFSSFRSLTDFSVLDVSYNRIETLSEEIPLKRLNFLDLRYNDLGEIYKNAFSQLAKIQVVDLSFNKLIEIHSETFRNNPEMNVLRVNDNVLRSIPKIDNLYKLTVLNLDYNQIASINLLDLFDNRINRKDLSLNDGEIVEIMETPAASSNKSKASVKTSSKLNIYLFNNRIQSFKNVILPDHVSNFNVRNNQIKTVCIANSHNLPDSRGGYDIVLRLSGNPLQCNWVNRQLNFSFCQIVIRNFVDFECTLIPTLLEPMDNTGVKLAGLKDDEEFLCRIEFSRNEPCVGDGNSDCSSKTSNEHCDDLLSDSFKSKVIRFTDKTSEGVKMYKYHVYVKGNDIETLKGVHYRISDECVSFYLEKSNVRVIEKNAFNQMTNLEILSLRDNQIRILPDNLFRNLIQLKELYLSNNRLIAFNGQTIASLFTLIKLELHNNSLTQLPITNTNQLLLLSLSDLTNLSLHDNPWSCECDFIQPFHYYLGNNTRILQQVTEINCIDEHSNKYNALQFDLSKCKPFLYLTAITTTTTFAVVIITIAALIFIYRREVRVLVYSRFRLRIFGPEVDDDVSSKQYDAFVAYNSKDEDFLINHLMPGLEAIPNPYRLCIHERDFPAGAFIQDSIMEAVHSSSRTIVLLSENFVDSGWCRIEFKTAHAQMMQDRCPRVLLIVLGEIPQNLDPEMELYLRTNTYLRWGERLFWEKLYYAMPDQRVTTSATDIMPMYQL